jgi:hypothetical protein
MNDNNISRRDFGKSATALLAALGISNTVETEAGRKERGPDFNLFAEWACELNSWRWPADWGPVPERWNFVDGMGGREKHERYKASGLSLVIHAMVVLAGGHKEVLRHHNVVRQQSMTNEEFENWYPKRFKI